MLLAMLPFFASTRRDGARLLSSMLVFVAIGLTQIHQLWGQILVIIAGSVSIYWGLAYRRLER
ncbi:MAG: hypothetical protein CMK50_04635 [Propionibacteriaceae bacterium]|nr:hypothetical protein [Propionibacteriaceae bacterium]